MNKVVIFSDSTCDLLPETIKEKDIKILPLYVNFGDESYKDGIDITTEKLYEMVETKTNFPKTAAISIFDFVEGFKPYIEEGYDIFFTGISSKMSVTMSNAIAASKEFPENRIFVSDSLNLSSAIGLLVLKATKFRDEGLSALEIKEKIDTLAPKVKATFAVLTMDYLHKGGRCSALAKIFGTFLKIKPVIRTKDGSMFVYKKPRGKMHVALDIMIDELKGELNHVDNDCIMVTHSIAPESEKYILEKLNETNIKNIMVTHAGCVISSHCGAGTIGILYIMDENI